MVMYRVQVDYARDGLLTDAGVDALRDRYLLPGEGPQDAFARVAGAYADDRAHAQRLYDYMSKLWFAPDDVVLRNGGVSGMLPASRFLNEVPDSMDGVTGTWNETVAISAGGGGVGTFWSNLRAMGEPVGNNGKSAGIVPFIVVQDAMARAVAAMGRQEDSSVVYLRVDHPEIEEFIGMGQPDGGDPKRKALHLQNAVVIDDTFMHAVERGEPYALKSPLTGAPVREVDARALWTRIIASRMEHGEPHIVYVDNVNRRLPEYQKKAGLSVKMASLCSGVVLPTGEDQYGRERTAVCCLCSVNLEHYEQWSVASGFMEDLMRFLDNLLQDFIDRAPVTMERARYSAMRERAVGLGVMGFHSFLQMKGLAFASEDARVWNKKIFGYLSEEANKASRVLADERGPNPDAAEVLVRERFSHKIALAPTVIGSLYCGVSSGIEPYAGVRNKHLQNVLKAHGRDDDETWTQIAAQGGSVRHLACLTDLEKEVFKTAFELDQRWLVDHAADRTPLVCQSQSLSLFISSGMDESELHALHVDAWKQGVKSLHGCYREVVQGAEVVCLAGSQPAVQATGTDGA